MRQSLVLAAALAAAMLVGPPAFAKKRAAKPSCTKMCKQIKDEMAAGKSKEDVEKDLNVSVRCVSNCTAPAPTHRRRHRTAKKS